MTETTTAHPTPTPRPHEQDLIAWLTGFDVSVVQQFFQGQPLDETTTSDIQTAWELILERKELAQQEGAIVLDLSLIDEPLCGSQTSTLLETAFLLCLQTTTPFNHENTEINGSFCVHTTGRHLDLWYGYSQRGFE